MAYARGHFGMCLTKLRAYQEAEIQLIESHRLFIALRDKGAVGSISTVAGRTVHEIARDLGRAVTAIVALYDAWEKPDEADHYRRLLEDLEPPSQRWKDWYLGPVKADA